MNDNSNTTGSGPGSGPAKQGQDTIDGLISGNPKKTTAGNVESASVSLERLSSAFASSARRWELVVYPSLFAFIILAGYGFFLIYNLATDAHAIQKSMVDISRNMESVSKNMTVMTQVINDQSITMKQMSHDIHGMNFYMGQMGYDLSIMNQNVSRPMSLMNSFLPW